ncbi:MAG TPA: SMC-Scp complex subunit ScpB [Halothiobacillaceae bacterium]|nr:SMC-Scp complex subunit ScpB [Halothiobacillaceae bacterium]
MSKTTPPDGLIELIEALLLVQRRPLTLSELQQAVGGETPPALLEAALLALQQRYAQHRYINLRQSGSQTQPQWQLVADQSLAPYLAGQTDIKPAKLSRAAHEILALIAWRQPITRGEIEAVRGVAVNTGIIRQLTERGWVQSLGLRDSPGRPEQFGTTPAFLQDFGLPSLEALPDFEQFAGRGDIDV